jgi:deoxyribonuclease-4
MIFGAHCSTAGAVHLALRRAKEIGAPLCRISVKNNMQCFGKPISPPDPALYAYKAAANHFTCVFGHAGYLINLGGSASGNRDRSIKSLIQEVELATQLRLPFLVLHPRAHSGVGCGRASSVGNARTLGRPHRSVLPIGDLARFP